MRRPRPGPRRRPPPRRKRGLRQAVVAALLTACALAGGATGSEATAPTPAAAAAGGKAGPDPDRAGQPRPFAARADSLVRARVEEVGIPGAALVVVEDARVALARGYGSADLASGRPVTPGETRFSVGSVSKLVTALAVMQQAEAGRLSLDRPVERGAAGDLLPGGPGGPITLHHLLTHTAGLAPAHVGLVARAPPGPGALREQLAAFSPRRTHPPGRLYLYSQFGYGLAGLVVAEATGRPFAVYVDRHIFGPLGMTRSSFRQQALDDPDTATGYFLAGDDSVPAPTAYHRLPPAAGLVTTPLDLARLATALLRGGVSRDSSRVLSPRAVRRMLARQWSPHPDPGVEGTAYGLFEHRACGIRALTTRGWTGGYSVYLHLVPGRDAGFVLLANASTLGGLQTALRDRLHRSLAEGGCAAAAEEARRDPTGRARPERPGVGAAPDPTRLFGHYRVVGYPGEGVEALGRYLLAPQVTVGPGPGGPAIDIAGVRVPAELHGPRLLEASWQEGKAQHFVFLADESGTIEHMMWGGIAYEKVPFYRTRAATTAAGLLLALIFLAGALWPATRRVRRRLGDGGDEAGDSVQAALRSGAVAVSLLALAAAAVLAFHLGEPERYRLAFGVPPTARAALWAPFLMLLGGSALAGGSAWAWSEKIGARGERVLWTAVALGGLAAGAAGAAVSLPPF